MTTSFLKVSLDKSSDLTSVKERSELLKCKSVPWNVCSVCYSHLDLYKSKLNKALSIIKKVNMHFIKNILDLEHGNCNKYKWTM